MIVYLLVRESSEIFRNLRFRFAHYLDHLSLEHRHRPLNPRSHLAALQLQFGNLRDTGPLNIDFSRANNILGVSGT